MWRFLTALSLCLALGACATATRFTAARDVHALLVSIRDEDSAGFEARLRQDSQSKAVTLKRLGL